MVFYRTYRPQAIEELDSSDVRTTLTSVLTKGIDSLPHAFLFTGPKGLGKTSTARILAKVINCTGRKQATTKKKESSVIDFEPCNKCEQCTSITDGTNMDVLEMDGASNRGIDEVRELKETIKLAPMSARKKVYIIDEVHMLTTEAFNALLKTLEEPPGHAVFILCTTELHKVPLTILSRCFHVGFKLATKDELLRSFKRIVKGEKIEIDEGALEYVASLSDGGFRDGAKMLEELVSLSGGKKITTTFIEEQYHLTDLKKIKSDIVTAFVKKDAKIGILAVQESERSGLDAKYLLTDLLTEFHTALLKQSGVEAGVVMKELDSVSAEDLLLILELLSKASQEIRFAVITQLPLELAILEWCSYVTTSTVETSQVVTSIKGDDSDVNIITLRKQVGNLAKIRAIQGEGEKKQEKVVVPTSGVSILHFSAEGEITKEWLMEFWGSLLDTLKKEHHTIAGVLRGCTIKSFDRKTLIIQTGYKFHKERLDETKTKQIMEQVCKELTGNPVSITIELVPEKK